MNDIFHQEPGSGLDIAVIGMAGRFPGAKNIHQFWDNLKNGVETITFFSGEELIKTGVNPDVIKNPNYIKAKGVLEGIEYFDAAFFGYLPPEAEVMDPQMRIFHECVWQALEDAAYDPGTYNQLIGLYAGASVNNAWIQYAMNWAAAHEILFSSGILCDKDFLSTHVSYKLNLKGPSSTIFTACSTSLLAIHQACQALLSGECKMALAGGVTIPVSQGSGYLYQEGMILSPEGHCRAFDAKARGTIFGSGVGVVVLKLLEYTMEDRDHVYAVIKGAAVNNDGNRKVGYTAPSGKGQTEVIRAALKAADIEAESIGYIETHGTGTPMGDPIEVEALNRAFESDRKGFIPIGSVKTNTGHLDIAAGIASFIKAVLILSHRIIPPSLHFHTHNPEIDFDNSPFYVNTKPQEWKQGKYPRRIGVSAFGIGGTNVHAILEEAPQTLEKEEKNAKTREYQLILLSANTPTALTQIQKNLARELRKNPQINLADVAYTLQEGRSALEYRKIMTCSNINETVEQLLSTDSGFIHRLLKKNRHKKVIFMFPGQGSQYVNMGLDLFLDEPLFRQEMFHCLELLEPLVDVDVKGVLYPHLHTNPFRIARSPGTGQDIDINSTVVAQPLLFIIEYALARLLMHWGITPDAMIGHSIGEYTAACLAGVFSLEEALKLVVLRGRLMQDMPPGAMLSVPLPEEKLKNLMEGEENIALAAVNGLSFCVVSGTFSAIDHFKKKLGQEGHETTRLHTSHAFHSAMMDPVQHPFQSQLSDSRLNIPRTPFISNITGRWIQEQEATSPAYWAAHLRKTVRFSHGISQLLEKDHTIFVEVGPGHVLSSLVRRQAKQVKGNDKPTDQRIINLMRHPNNVEADTRFLLEKIGQLWLYGKPPDGKTFYPENEGHRISLPTYPFERKRFWAVVENLKESSRQFKKRELDKWFYIPSWKRSTAVPTATGIIDGPSKKTVEINTSTGWLVFIDSLGLGSLLVNHLKKRGAGVTTVEMGPLFEKKGPAHYTFNPHNNSDYDQLFKELAKAKVFPSVVLHLWNVTGKEKGTLLERMDNTLESGFYSLLAAIKTFGLTRKKEPGELRLWVITDHMLEVVGGDQFSPLKASLLGLLRIINLELPYLRCRTIDVQHPLNGNSRLEPLANGLLKEILTDPPNPVGVTAFRGAYRWELTYEPIRPEAPGQQIPRLKQKGVYLVTGGLGGVGLVLARHLAASVQARLVLTGRSPFPPRDQWNRWLDEHDEQDPISIKIKLLMEMEKMGTRVIVKVADVTDREQMQKVISHLKERFGSLNGVIHSAGAPDGALILRRTRELSEKVLAPKVKGTLVLAEILRDEPLDFFMLCSSILSIIGDMGQAAYSAANAFMDAFAFYNTRRHGTFTLAVNWDGWEDLGMTATATNTAKFEFKKTTNPLFQLYMVAKASGNLVLFLVHLDIDNHWFLDEHRSMGSALLPGTAYLEIARAAFVCHEADVAIDIRNVYYLNPLLVAEKEKKELLVVLKKQQDHFEFFFLTCSTVGQGRWMPHARGEIAPCETTGKPIKKWDITDLEAQCRKETITFDGKKNKLYEGSIINVGPRWNCLLEVKKGELQELARLQLTEPYWPDLETYPLHPALLDVATATSFFAADKRHMKKGPYLPFSYKRVRIKGKIPEHCFAYSRYVENPTPQPGTISFNVIITDEQGNERVEVEGFTLLTVLDEGRPIVQETRETFPVPPEISSLTPQSIGMGKSGNKPDEAKLQVTIRPSEGIEAFNRVLGSSLPQVLISLRDLPRVLRYQTQKKKELSASEKDRRETTAPAIQERSDLSTVYVAPRDKIEQTLAEIIQKHLGIDRIGIHDNLFELGATSLDFAQVIGRLGKAVGREIPLVAMFSYPTISDLKNYLEQEGTGLKFSQEEQERLEKTGSKKRRKLAQRKSHARKTGGTNG